MRVVRIRLGQTGRRFTAAGAAIALSMGPGTPCAHAAITVFNDQAAFLATAGATQVETFDSVVGEPDFRTVPLTVGDLSLAGFGQQYGRNYIDQPAAQFPELEINGTANVNAVTGLPADGFDLSFAFPVYAFGATFAGLQDGLVRTSLVLNGQTLTPGVTSGDVIRFYGLVSDTPFTSVRFQSAGGEIRIDGFSFDDVRYSAAAVPEPASWATMILGFGAVGGTARAARRTRPRYA